MLKGRHLLERGLPPGPALGDWVRAAFERQLDGDIRSLDDALAWLDAALAEGVTPPSTAGQRRARP